MRKTGKTGKDRKDRKKRKARNVGKESGRLVIDDTLEKEKRRKIK